MGKVPMGEVKTGGPSPELTCNVLSWFTWQWVQPFINIGNRRIVQAENLYDLNPRERTDYCERRWNTWYEKHESRTGKPPSAWKLLFVSSGREMVWSFLACPFWLMSVVSQVFIIRFLVAAAEEREKTLRWWRALLLILGMMFSANVQSISQHFSFTSGQKSGLKIRSAVSMAVFNKLMRLKIVALGGTSSGQMLNLLTNDTQKFLDAATFLGYTTFGVVDSVVVAGLAIGEVGISALPGVAVIILAQYVQVCLAQAVGHMRKRSVKCTDARVRSIQEIMSGVRVVKYNGWTNPFLERINELRAVEMKWIKRAALLKASTSTLREGVAPVAALVTFGAYVGLHGGDLSASKAFTLLGLYSILVRIYSICPMGVQSAWEAKIGIQRLQTLMDLPEGNANGGRETVEEINKIYPEAAIVLSRATFTWNLQNQEKAEGEAPVASPVGGPTSFTKFSRAIFKKGRTNVSSQNSAEIHQNGATKQHDGLELDGQELSEHELWDVELAVAKGELVAIVGPVGSGKSSFLQAILGEMEYVTGACVVNGALSYAPQQPWIVNDSIKNNILFESEYDEARYARTIAACALDQDLLAMPAADSTEIGEKGVNLSGGQKARISLARACYSESKVVLLDDPLAAVDVPTGRHLIEHVLGGVLKGRTVILVTHNKSSLEICDRVLVMQGGKLQEHQVQEVVQKLSLSEVEEESDIYSNVDVPSKLSVGNDECGKEGDMGDWKDVEEERRSIAVRMAPECLSHVDCAPTARKSTDLRRISARKSGSTRQSETGRASSRKSGLERDVADARASAAASASAALTVEEDRNTGEVTYHTYLSFARGSGLWLWALVMFLMCAGQAVRVMVDFWVSIWVDAKYNLSTNLYLGIYALWVGGMLVFSLGRGLLFTEAAMRAAKSMHRLMTRSVLRSPQLFFDQNPVGRIVNRFSKDQSNVDDLLPWTGQGMIENLVAVLGVMVLVGVIMPWNLLSLPPFLFAFRYCQQRYVAVSRELKRLDGLSRSPIYAHFTQTLQGVDSVRAYKTEAAMHDRFRDCIDANTRAFVMFVHTSRWLGIRLDLAAALCLTTSALLAVLLRHSISPGLIGVVLVQSLQLTGFFQYGVRLVADTENLFTSVERNQVYARLPSEADPNSPPGLIADEWPDKGKVEFRNYTMAYRVDLLPVLNNLTFEVRPREKVGILGRTGAGKSSIVAALFRMVENSACTGNIVIDDIDVARVGLDDLRLRLSIIPQDPVLFRGTVRLNLDPFQLHDDVEIYEAVAKVQLTEKIKTLDRGLDSVVTENGDNFSVGQRQLLCLARSLLRRSKIVVMDEATASVDGETDKLIQHTMRSVFRDCTVLTIAHRIDTVIDCDRVLVLAKGGVLSEFDSPVNLLRKAEEVDLSVRTAPDDHVFAHMVLQAGPVVARQLRDSAEAAERERNARTIS